MNNIFFLLCFVLIPINILAQLSSCGKESELVYKSCKEVLLINIPSEIKKQVEKAGCFWAEQDFSDPGIKYEPVLPESGLSIELNSDSVPEYLFVCIQPAHGPGELILFGLVRNKWVNIFPLDKSVANYGDSPALGIYVLESKTNSFNDLCTIDENGNYQILRFKEGRYEFD